MELPVSREGRYWGDLGSEDVGSEQRPIHPGGHAGAQCKQRVVLLNMGIIDIEWSCPESRCGEPEVQSTLPRHRHLDPGDRGHDPERRGSAEVPAGQHL